MLLVFEMAAAAECSPEVQKGCMPTEGEKKAEAQISLVARVVLKEQEIGLVAQKVKQ
jgi:hypothetical protein